MIFFYTVLPTLCRCAKLSYFSDATSFAVFQQLKHLFQRLKTNRLELRRNSQSSSPATLSIWLLQRRDVKATQSFRSKTRGLPHFETPYIPRFTQHILTWNSWKDSTTQWKSSWKKLFPMKKVWLMKNAFTVYLFSDNHLQNCWTPLKKNTFLSPSPPGQCWLTQCPRPSLRGHTSRV